MVLLLHQTIFVQSEIHDQGEDDTLATATAGASFQTNSPHATVRLHPFGARTVQYGISLFQKPFGQTHGPDGIFGIMGTNLRRESLGNHGAAD